MRNTYAVSVLTSTGGEGVISSIGRKSQCEKFLRIPPRFALSLTRHFFPALYTSRKNLRNYFSFLLSDTLTPPSPSSSRLVFRPDRNLPTSPSFVYDSAPRYIAVKRFTAGAACVLYTHIPRTPAAGARAENEENVSVYARAHIHIHTAGLLAFLVPRGSS